MTLKDDPPMHGPCVYLESGPARSLGQDGSFTHKGRAEEDHPSIVNIHQVNIFLELKLQLKDGSGF